SAISALASGVRQADAPGPMPITASRPRGRPIALRSSGVGARAIAQVARFDCRRDTASLPSGPTAASAAPSATPQQPAARNAASLAADAERQYRRMKHERISVGRHRAIGDEYPQIGLCGPSRRAGMQPIRAIRLLYKRDGLAAEQGGGDRFDALGIGDMPARR